MLLTLDPGRSMGFCVGDDAPARWGVIDLRTDSEAASYVRARIRLTEMIRGNGVTAIGIESSIVGADLSPQSRFVLFGLRTIALMVAYDCGVPIREVTSSAWRLHFLGAGQAPKEVPKAQRRPWLKRRAVDRCRDVGLGDLSEDTADAVGIFAYLRSIWRAEASGGRKRRNIRAI